MHHTNCIGSILSKKEYISHALSLYSTILSLIFFLSYEPSYSTSISLLVLKIHKQIQFLPLLKYVFIGLARGLTDWQGLHAGWDHRLCEVPTAPSQGDHSPLFLQIFLINKRLRIKIWIKRSTSTIIISCDHNMHFY